MKNDQNYYKLNAAKCKICNTVVVATDKEAKHACLCKNLIVTGDLSSSGLIRFIKQIDYYHDQYEEMSQYCTGHPVAPGHAIIKPQSALKEIVYGKCFIQRHLHSPIRSCRIFDEWEQSLQRVEIEIGEDYNYSVTARFMFRPVNAFKFYICGEPSDKNIDFMQHIIDDIFPLYIKGGHTKYALFEILLNLGYQDRTGMKPNDDWRI